MTEQYSADYYMRVLLASQAATVVVDKDGVIRFASPATEEVAGLAPDGLVGKNFADYIVADDLDEAIDTFAAALSDADRDARWPPTLVRIVANDGSPIPCEVIGHGMFEDPVVGGVVFSLRRMDETFLLHRILETMATGAPIGSTLRLVTEMVEVPPLHLDACVAYYQTERESATALWHVTSGRSETFAELVGSTDPDLPWNTLLSQPDEITDRAGEDQLGRNRDRDLKMAAVAELPEGVARRLASAGYCESWVLPLYDEKGMTGVVTALVRRHTGPGAVSQRLRRARDVCELAFVRHNQENQLRHAALHDRLTGLPNRARFFAALERELGQKIGPMTGVMYLDLDGFKPLNDRHGHAFGDTVLIESARRLNAALRPGDLAARLGGDEFAVLVEGIDSAPQAQKLAERLLGVLQAPIHIGGHVARVSATIGVAIGPLTSDRSTLLEAADQAMYRGKRAGKGVIELIEMEP